VPEEVIAEARNPDGRLVQIHAHSWNHVLDEHAEMLDHLEGTVSTIEAPDHREPDQIAGRDRYFRRGGPQRWLRVVTEFAGETDRLVTAFPQVNDPTDPLS
jgi:hypothetical protein